MSFCLSPFGTQACLNNTAAAARYRFINKGALVRGFTHSAPRQRRSTPASLSTGPPHRKSALPGKKGSRPFPQHHRSFPSPDQLNPFLPKTWEPRAAFAVQRHQNVHELVATYALALTRPDNQILQTLAGILGLDQPSALEPVAKAWKAETTLIRHPSDTPALRQAAAQEGLLAIHRVVLQDFLAWAAHSPATPPALQTVLKRLYDRTDYTTPEAWAPIARRYHRKVILHVGPTNSGKTYQALAALARSRTGIYAGPLRLLAHEVYSRFNSGTIGGLTEPKPCNLVTGEEQRIVTPHGTPSILSCTVEMVPVNQMFEVVVIDEIQMIADKDRGDAWTNAFLNVHAHELHLCGEERAVPVIEALAELTGDDVEVRRYQRLSGLEVSTKSLNGSLKKVERGDCVVTFSRNNIFAVKQAIEKATDLKVVVAYGGLPPEVREEQARVFNQEDGADVMVASDAIGMGLNLKIRRVIFESLHKFDGNQIVPLSLPQVKQIGGRAGRYGMHTSTSGDSAADLDNETPQATSAGASSSVGQVTTLDPEDLPLLKKAMAANVSPITAAVVSPSTALIVYLNAAVAPNVPWSQVLALSRIFGRHSDNYTIPIAGTSIKAAAMLDDYQALTIDELQVLAQAPVNHRDEVAVESFRQFVQAHIDGKAIDIPNWAQQRGVAHLLPESHRPEETLANIAQSAGGDLLSLESCHRVMSFYLWLSYRLPVTFDQPELVRILRRNIEQSIDSVLNRRTEWLRKKAKANKAEPLKLDSEFDQETIVTHAAAPAP